MKQNSKKKNFLHKADRQNMPVCFITGKIYRKQEYEIKTETDCKINYIDDFKHIKFQRVKCCISRHFFRYLLKI